MCLETLIELKKRIENKKIVLFGTGEAAEKLWYWLDFLGAAKRILFCADNNESKWGSKFLNQYEIQNPENIKLLDLNNMVVLIASCYYNEISSQISKWGKYCVYNAYSNCDWEFKEIIDLYEDREIFLLTDNGLENGLIKQCIEIMIPKLDVKMVTEEDVGEFSLHGFEDKVFWIASKKHMEIEKSLEKLGYRANTDFYSITPFIFNNYCYLNEGSENKCFDDWEIGCKDIEDYFCPIPFERLYLYSTSANLCCPPFCNHISVGNIQNLEDMEKIWNGAMAKTFRESILSGSYYFCNRKKCRYLYSGLLQKKEEITDPFYRQIIDENQLEIVGGPSYMNIGIDGMCNMQCKMCRDKNVRNPDETEDKLEDILKKMKQYRFDNLETLFIAGNGEVFLNPIYLKILYNLDQFHMPNLKKIIFKSNGILLDRHTDLIEKLSKRYDIAVSISVDGVYPETYRLVRRNANYNKLFENLQLLSTLKEKQIVDEIELSFCIQRDNFRELIPFVKVAKRYKADTILLQKVMGQSMSDSVQCELNVYHDLFVNLLKKAYCLAQKEGLDVSAEAVMKFIKE